MTLRLIGVNILNFKSFKGEHTISVFDPKFSAIVGPNGSGKSNIIDSILFVLGFKARKMRHSILKDLITTGCTECVVELVFNVFRISRSLKGRIDESGDLKGATSRYELNGTEVSAGDAIEFLKENGIDLDNNRFLILQGEIEGIAMMNPIELLEYIEDCIGTSGYKTRMEAVENEIKTCQDDQELANSKLKFVETDYEFKKGRRDEKAKLLISKHEAVVKKNKIVLMKQEIAKRKEASLETECIEVQGRLGVIVKKNEGANREIRRLETELLDMGLKGKEAELVRYRNEYNSVERDNRAKEQKQRKIEKSLDKLQKEIDDKREANTRWEKESKNLESTYSTNSKEIDHLEIEVSRKMKALDKYEEIKEQKTRRMKLEDDLMKLIEKKEAFDTEKNSIEALNGKANELKNKIGRAEANTNNLGDRKAIEIEILKLRKDIEATRQEIERRKRRAEEFEWLERNYKKEQEVILQLKDIPGVFGTLRSLGTFDKQYEEAIEASTKSLGSVVVDKTSTAEQCIAIINKNKLDRTTFIILDKLNEPKNEEIGKIPQQAVLLYKQVKTEPRFTKCFYFAIKDTLCVANLEDARVLAFGKIRKRVVTMDGKLLEKSGVMSGGKTAKKLKSSAELEQIYTNMQALLSRKSVQLEEMLAFESQKAHLGSLSQHLQKLNTEISKREAMVDLRELNIIEKHISATKEELTSLEHTNFPLEVTELRSDIQLLNEKIDHLQKINQDIRLKLSLEPINEISKLEREYTKQKREYDSISLDLLPDVKILERLEDEYNSILKNYNILQDRINKLREEMGNDYHFEAECKTRLDEIAELRRESKRVYGNCRSRLQELQGEYVLTKSLLQQIEPDRILHLETDIGFIEEMDDTELKQKSRDMIDELERGGKRQKDKEGVENKENVQNVSTFGTNTDEDLEMYRVIFAEYETSKRNYDELRASSEYIASKLVNLKIEAETLSSERLRKFMDGFNSINANIKEIFNLITFGGNAELDLLDYLNPFNDGIILSVMPPKKSWKQISNLSGGEKTLSSLSLIFALHKYRPSSFYIMDEIDAALDFKNVSVISEYVGRVDAQFIIISLRNDMFEKAKTLIGVYKVNDVSRAITIDMSPFLAS